MKKYKVHIIILFALNIVFFLSGKIDSLRLKFLVSEFNFADTTVHYRYGDLYRLSKVANFQETLLVKSARTDNHMPGEADILLAGDSYFRMSIAGEFISSDLENRFGVNVFDITKVNSGSVDDPVNAVMQLNIDNSKKRILVLETAERFSLERGLKQYTNIERETGDDAVKIFLYRTLINRQYFIEHNCLTYPVIRFKNTLNYNVFRQIDLNIGAYSDSPPMLFYNQDVEFAAKKVTPGQFDMLVNNIEEMKNILKDRYNITLLYVIIPDKYSVYNDLVNGQYTYSGYIRELLRRLNEKNINFIDVYSQFMDYRKQHHDNILYTKSDSHFNADGKAIFVEQLGKKIEEIKMSW